MHYHHNNNKNGGNSTNSTKEKNGSNEESASANKSHHSLTSYLYLFLEEVLFLKERGLVEVYQIHDTNNVIHNNNDTMQNNVYDLKLPSPFPHSNSSLVPSTSFLHHELDVKKISTPELYSLLSVNNIPFPVYLVYAHLRTQTFIVLRHFPYRSLVVMNNNENNAMNKKEGIDREKDDHYDEQQHNTKSKEVTSTTAINNNNKNGKEAEQSEETMLHNQRNQSMLLQEQKSLKTFLRMEAFHLKPPLMLSDLNTATNKECTISFDIYKPKSDFRRSSPGKPDFYVSVLNFNSHTTTFSQLYNFVSEPLIVPSISHHDNLKNNQYYQSLIVDSKNDKENENVEEKVPIKLGLVSDSGTVIMFGITLGEIANIASTTTDKNDESTTTSK